MRFVEMGQITNPVSYTHLLIALGRVTSLGLSLIHILHKLHEPELSNKVLKEALKVSGDPMILNIIGKNEQDMKMCIRDSII